MDNFIYLRKVEMATSEEPVNSITVLKKLLKSQDEKSLEVSPAASTEPASGETPPFNGVFITKRIFIPHRLRANLLVKEKLLRSRIECLQVITKKGNNLLGQIPDKEGVYSMLDTQVTELAQFEQKFHFSFIEPLSSTPIVPNSINSQAITNEEESATIVSNSSTSNLLSRLSIKSSSSSHRSQPQALNNFRAASPNLDDGPSVYIDEYLDSIKSLVVMLEQLQAVNTSNNVLAKKWIDNYNKFISRVVTRLIVKDFLFLLSVYQSQLRNLLV